MKRIFKDDAITVLRRADPAAWIVVMDEPDGLYFDQTIDADYTFITSWQSTAITMPRKCTGVLREENKANGTVLEREYVNQRRCGFQALYDFNSNRWPSANGPTRFITSRWLLIARS